MGLNRNKKAKINTEKIGYKMNSKGPLHSFSCSSWEVTSSLSGSWWIRGLSREHWTQSRNTLSLGPNINIVMFPSSLVLSVLLQCVSAVWARVLLLTDMYGTMHSPSFPEPYPKDSEIHWNISVPEGYQIRLYFMHFDIEPSYLCEYDYVKVSPFGYIHHHIIRGVTLNQCLDLHLFTALLQIPVSVFRRG